jgi:DNA polymerase elongation subunit (family B)
MNTLNPHNQKIYINSSNYKNVLSDTIKNREDYLNSNDIKHISNKVKRSHDLLFLSNDMSESLSFNDYKLFIHGILPCGSKTTIIVNSIYPSVDIEYKMNLTDEENLEELKILFANAKLKKTLKNRQLDIKSVKIVNGRKLIGFSDTEGKFIKISFKKLFHRTSFIKLLKDLQIPSYNNDLSSYYRSVSRLYKIHLTGWNKITDYSLAVNSDYKSKYVFSVDIKNITPYTDEMYEKEFSDIDLNLIRKDKMISMSFDIEQFSSDFDPKHPNKQTRIPSGKIPEDVIFNIGMTYQFINEKDSFLNIGLVTKEADAHEKYLTIICKSEKVLLQAFGYINSLIQPDFIYEFNGSEFDWINMYDKFLHYHILDEICQDLSLKKLNAYELRLENIDKYFYKCEFIKISADRLQKKMLNIKLPGYIAFDLRVTLMQLNPTESKSSLKFYLDLYNLSSKDDMPIPELFNYYLTGDIKGISAVVKYCYIDCFRLHELIYKINIIQDRREVGKLSYTSMFDNFYRAGGCRVRNLIIANCLDMNLFFNSIKKEESDNEIMLGKYPGALVLPPIKGLVNNTLSLKEFCKTKLEIDDDELINQCQEIANKNYQAVFINRNIHEVEF